MCVVFCRFVFFMHFEVLSKTCSSHTENLCVLPSPSLAHEPTRGTDVWPLLCASNFLEPLVRVRLSSEDRCQLVHPEDLK